MTHLLPTINPHDVETVALDWIGVITAVGLGVIGAVALLWGRWKKTMEAMLDTHAKQLNKDQKDLEADVQREFRERERKHKHDTGTTGSNT